MLTAEQVSKLRESAKDAVANAFQLPASRMKYEESSKLHYQLFNDI